MSCYIEPHAGFAAASGRAVYDSVWPSHACGEYEKGKE